MTVARLLDESGGMVTAEIESVRLLTMLIADYER